MEPVRILRVEREDDALLVSRLVGRQPADPNLRGWAAIAPVLDDRARHLVRAALERTRVLVFAGARGVAITGDLFSLFNAGRELATMQDAAVRGFGRALRDGAAALDGGPGALDVGGTRFDWARPVVMGIVNVTPDSFSDGGRFLDPSAAVEHALTLVADGADLLDVGGESTRPRGRTYGEGAQPVADDEEIRRVVPVIRAIRERTKVPISIDTRKSAVARAAIEAGASMVNDVSGLLHDPALASVAARACVPLCLMHTPADIEQLSHESASDDAVAEVLAGLAAATRRAHDAGFDDESLLVYDPGIGFGKSVEGNLALLRHVESIAALGRPVLVGASRKSSIARVAAGGAGHEPLPMQERVAASLAAAVVAASRGAHILRVHDVRETVQSLRVATAILGR